jgi:hypothetical protein
MSNADLNTDADLARAVETIDDLRGDYETIAARAKLEYLESVVAAKKKFGTTRIAKGLGLTRHRIYQIEREAAALRTKLY